MNPHQGVYLFISGLEANIMAEPPTPCKSVELRPKAVLNHPDVILGFPKQLYIRNTNTDSVGSMLRLK
jgi:hypothetical protein